MEVAVDVALLSDQVGELTLRVERTDTHLADALRQFQAVSLQLADYSTLVHQLTNDLSVMKRELLGMEKRLNAAGVAGAKKTCPEHGRVLPCPCGRK